MSKEKKQKIDEVHSTGDDESKNFFDTFDKDRIKRGDPALGHMGLFVRAVRSGQMPTESTVSYFADAFESFLEWSNDNPKESISEKRRKLSESLGICNSGKGARKKGNSANEYIELRNRATYKRALQVEEILRREITDREGTLVSKQYAMQAVAIGWHVPRDGNDGTDTLKSDCRRNKAIVEHEFSVRNFMWRQQFRLLS